jgi:NAD(P)-dependent dehydrogenase (short-subunit alcohol dehydrogenase family)
MLRHLSDLRPAHVVYAGGGSSEEEIACAGIPHSSLAEKSVSDNLLAPLDLVRQISSVGTAASVTVLSSINADGGFGLPAYSAAKAGLRGFLKSAGAGLAQDGVRLNLLTLGTVKHAGVIGRHSEAHFEQLLLGTPMGRFTTPEQVADACLFIARNEAVCGAEIVLDSGQSLGD